MTARDQPQLRAIVDRVCEDMGLDRFDGNTVEAWVQQDPKTWAGCCGSDCDPCNGTLALAAQRVLSLLEAAARERPSEAAE